MNDLGLDSLDHVEVIMAMEDEFGKWTILKVGTKSCLEVPLIGYPNLEAKNLLTCYTSQPSFCTATLSIGSVHYTHM